MPGPALAHLRSQVLMIAEQSRYRGRQFTSPITREETDSRQSSVVLSSTEHAARGRGPDLSNAVHHTGAQPSPRWVLFPASPQTFAATLNGVGLVQSGLLERTLWGSRSDTERNETLAFGGETRPGLWWRGRRQRNT